MRLAGAQGRGAWRRGHAVAAAVVAAAAAAAMLSGCAAVRQTVPQCSETQRLAIVAQTVPGASYVPCISQLPQGWSASAFDAVRGGTSFLLNSDRNPGRPVKVVLAGTCTIAGATPTTPRGPGVRTYLRLGSISPRFAGNLYDVFPGGCVTYSFDFERGPHIALMEEFEAAAGLHSRQQLTIELRKELGVELDP
jgi:hypothetical protein